MFDDIFEIIETKRTIKATKSEGLTKRQEIAEEAEQYFQRKNKETKETLDWLAQKRKELQAMYAMK